MHTGRPVKRSRRSARLEGKIHSTQLLRDYEFTEENHVRSRRRRRKDVMLAMTHASKDPQLLWAGNQVVSVEIAGCCFMLKEVKISSGQKTWAIFLTAAHVASGLADLVGTDIYLTPGSVRSPLFNSPFPRDTGAFLIQERIWTFLDDFFLKEGIKPVPVLMPQGVLMQETPDNLWFSGELLWLLRGHVGRYTFESVAPRATFLVGALQDEYETPVVQLMTVDPGHVLFGCCKEGTRIPLDVLTHARNYSFRGHRAQDMEEMWLYFLMDLIEPRCEADREK